MASVRPVVTVYSAEGASAQNDSLKTPAVFSAPLRPDLVQFIHDQMRLNKRQAYAVSKKAGYQTAAESWGTGRAVARIPRVPGGGTHRAGQGAFGNMCRGGGMFAPTKVWRKWHHKINITQKRHAIASAIASTALPALVEARGHRISEVAEFPMVVSDDVQGFKKTRDAMALFKKLGLASELDAVVKSKKIRVGKGKHRDRRYVMKKGPLVVYDNDDGIVKAFRNIPGVTLCNVNALNLMHVAPGGQLGRLTVWTRSAFAKLKPLFGTRRCAAELKKGYNLPKSVMTNCDLHRIINSDEIQSVLNPRKEAAPKPGHKKNPLVHHNIMEKLNPGHLARREARKKVAHVKKPNPKKGTVELKKFLNKKRLARRFINELREAHKAPIKEEQAQNEEEEDEE